MKTIPLRWGNKGPIKGQGLVYLIDYLSSECREIIIDGDIIPLEDINISECGEMVYIGGTNYYFHKIKKNKWGILGYSEEGSDKICEILL